MAQPPPGTVALTTFSTIRSDDVAFTVLRAEDGMLMLVAWDDTFKTGATLPVADPEELRKFARGILKGLSS